METGDSCARTIYEIVQVLRILLGLLPDLLTQNPKVYQPTLEILALDDRFVV